MSSSRGSSSRLMGSSAVAWGPYSGEPADDAGSRSSPDPLPQVELGSGVALFELSPVFVSSPTQGADLVAAHDYGDGQQLLVVISAGHLWLNYQVGRCQPYVKSFGLPGPCTALALAPDGVRMALLGADSVVHIVEVDNAIRSPQIDYEPVTLGAKVNPHSLCWWRDRVGRDLLVLARAHGAGAIIVDVEMLVQDSIEVEVEIAEIQTVQALGADRLLLRDVDGAYHWLDERQSIALARYRRGVSIRAQSHYRDGPVWSVYTPSRSILELLGPELKGTPVSAHLVPESTQQIVFDNYIFCISSDKIEVVSLILSDINFEFNSSTGAAFDIALATMQTIPTVEPLTAHVISCSQARMASLDHPTLLVWSNTAVRRVFRSSTIIDLVEIVVSAFVDRAGDAAKLPSPDQIALLALSLRLDPADFFEFAGDRAWNVERNFAVAFDFYESSQLSFHKLVRLCMEASRHCDIVGVVDGILAQRPDLPAKHRGELAHCQFYCLLHTCLETGDDARLFEFGRQSRDLDAGRALDALRTIPNSDLMLRWCLAHDLVAEYLAICAEASGSLSSAEIDRLVAAGYRSAIVANEAVFLALNVRDQLRLILADVEAVGHDLWSALLTLPLRIPLSSLPSLFHQLKPLGAMLPVYIVAALLLLETVPGHLDQNAFTQQLHEWRAQVDYSKLIEVCLANDPPLRMGAAILLECNQDRCEAALTRLSAVASEDFVSELFVRVLIGEVRKLSGIEEKSLLILMAQQIWQHKSSSPFESVLVPFVDELAPVILGQPSPWVTSRLFLLALTSSPEAKVFERDDYGGALKRVLASPELLHLLTGSRSVTFTFRHDSPPLPLHVHPCGRHSHQSS